MKYDVITIGGATEDLSIYTEEGVLIKGAKNASKKKLFAFEYGAKVKVDKISSNFGGGAVNAATCFARLGFKVSTIIAVGDDDRGKRIVGGLKKEHVSTTLVEKIKGESTGFSPAIVGEDNEHIFFSIRAANGKLKITNEDLVELKKTKWIYLASLSGDWVKTLAKIFSVKKVNIAWNPGRFQLAKGARFLMKYITKTKVLILNQSEALELVVSHPKYKNQKNNSIKEINELLKIIKSWGPEIVVITEGEKGASVYNGKNIYFMPAHKSKKIINTIGVGDAFGATFVSGLELFKSDIKQAMQSAVINSSSVTEFLDSHKGLLTKSSLIKHLK